MFSTHHNKIMKEIIIVKLFLVLCCDFNINGAHTYEVKSLEDPTETGIVGSYRTYDIGDTIRVEYRQKIAEVKK